MNTEPRPPETLRRRILIRAVKGAALLTLIAVALLALDERSRGLVANTLWLAAGSIGLAVPPGTWLGLTLARTDVWGRRSAMLLLSSLLLVPLYLQAAAWQAGFGLEGWQTLFQPHAAGAPWLDGWRGAVWVHGCAGIPWVALFVGAAARSLAPALEESALLELSLFGVFSRVTMRLLMPSIVLAALWVAITTMTEISVTDLFAVRTYAEELYIDLNAGSWNVALDAEIADQEPVPALGGIVLCGLAAVALLAAAGRTRWSAARLSDRAPTTFALGRCRGYVSVMTWVLVVIVVLLPLGSLVYKAGATIEATNGDVHRRWSPVKAIVLTTQSPRDHDAEFMWSAATAASTVCLTLALAAPLAYAARRSRIAAGLAALIAVAGLSTPGPLIGLALITLFNDPAWPLLNALYDRTIAVAVLGCTLRAFPIVFFPIWHAFQTIPPSQLDSGWLDGIGPLRGIWLCIRQRPLPFALAGFVAGVFSFGELSSTILVYAPGMVPLSVRIFQLLHFNVEDQVAAIILMLIAIHAVAAWLVIGVARRVVKNHAA